jgi:hypothetical protein
MMDQGGPDCHLDAKRFTTCWITIAINESIDLRKVVDEVAYGSYSEAI